jgi:tetratricopeptide (TPR) repeat protein
MRKTPHRSWLPLLVAVAIVHASPADVARAADESPAASEAAATDEAPAEKPKKKSRKEEREERQKYAIKPRTGKVFEKVRAAIDEEQYEEAEKQLGKLKLPKLSPFERAQALRLHGYTAYGQEDHDAAIEHLRGAVAENALLANDQADVLFQVAQIQAMKQRWPDVIATLEPWLATVEKPNSAGYYLLALSHFQQGNLDAALLPAKKAVEIAKKPQQVWLQLLLAIHLTKKDYASAAPVLYDLVSYYPNAGKGYWLQLSAVYGALGDNERALGVMELAHRRGLLTGDKDLRRLTELTLYQGIPSRAAERLEADIAEKRVAEDAESYELLSNSWLLAREIPKAEEPLARAAALSPKGELYVRLAQVHLMQEEWSPAADALRKAIAKGQLTDASAAQLLLGFALYNEKKLPEARTWFARAQQSETAREQAETWLQRIDEEIANASASAAG